jgi:predicted metal-dependent HD superfamily phosphohydrolase
MSEVDRQELRHRWDALWARLNVTAARTPSIEPLIAAYDEPVRAYHNLHHIMQCLRELDQMRIQCVGADAVELAIWYHDVVYDSTRHDNEERSAAIAAEGLRTAGIASEKINTVIELIHATKHTHPPITPDAEILVDIDLSILGQDPETFDSYERGIRQEYAHVEDRAFREGRSAILQRFLDRPAIFATPRMRSRYEEPARHNIRRSLLQLKR